MSFVTNILTPIIQTLFYMFIVFGGLFLIYRMLRPYLPNMRLFFKFKILRRPYREKDIIWCIEAQQKGMGIIDVKKFLLLHGISLKRTDEMIFLFNEIQKRMKGGGKNGKQFKQSTGTDEEREIPKV